MAAETMQRELEMLKDNYDKFDFPLESAYCTFFFNECEKVIKNVIKNVIGITIS